MRNYDDVLDLAGTTRLTTSTTVVVTEEVTLTPRRSEARAFIAKEEATWEWSDLRDYVVTEIEKRFGAFPRDMRKESGIFKSFLTRYADQAPAIARFAFEVEDGFWGGAPISVNRFCKNSDPFFADKIKVRLVDQPVSGW